MSKKFEKFLKDTNKDLKKRGFFKNHEITIDGDFTSEYNFINLSRDGHHFPIATVATEGEAIAAISGYMTGMTHFDKNSYVRYEFDNIYDECKAILEKLSKLSDEELRCYDMSKYVCSQCGSHDIEVKAWVKANTNELVEWCDDEIPECWCNNCREKTTYELEGDSSLM